MIANLFLHNQNVAQRELEAQHQRILRVQRSKKMRETQLIAQQSGILALRAQMPAFSEFHEVFMVVLCLTLYQFWVQGLPEVQAQFQPLGNC